MKEADVGKQLCGAQTRSGEPCRRPKARGRSRCRLHGGAPGSGAPSGERNGRYTDGEHTNQAKAERRWVQDIVRTAEGGQPKMSGTELTVVPALSPRLEAQKPL